MVDGQQCRAACADEQRAVGLGTCFVLDKVADLLVGTPICVDSGVTGAQVTVVTKIWKAMLVRVEVGSNSSLDVYQDGLAIALGIASASISNLQVVFSNRQGDGGRRLGTEDVQLSYALIVPEGESADELRSKMDALATFGSAEQDVFQGRLFDEHGVVVILIESIHIARIFKDESDEAAEGPTPAPTWIEYESFDKPLTTAAAASPLLMGAVICVFCIFAGFSICLKKHDLARFRKVAPMVSDEFGRAISSMEAARRSVEKVLPFMDDLPELAGASALLSSGASPTAAGRTAVRAAAEQLKAAAVKKLEVAVAIHSGMTPTKTRATTRASSSRTLLSPSRTALSYQPSDISTLPTRGWADHEAYRHGDEPWAQRSSGDRAREHGRENTRERGREAARDQERGSP